MRHGTIELHGGSCFRGLRNHCGYCSAGWCASFDICSSGPQSPRYRYHIPHRRLQNGEPRGKREDGRIFLPETSGLDMCVVRCWVDAFHVFFYAICSEVCCNTIMIWACCFSFLDKYFLLNGLLY